MQASGTQTSRCLRENVLKLSRPKGTASCTDLISVMTVGKVSRPSVSSDQLLPPFERCALCASYSYPPRPRPPCRWGSLNHGDCERSNVPCSYVCRTAASSISAVVFPPFFLSTLQLETLKTIPKKNNEKASKMRNSGSAMCANTALGFHILRNYSYLLNQPIFKTILYAISFSCPR